MNDVLSPTVSMCKMSLMQSCFSTSHSVPLKMTYSVSLMGAAELCKLQCQCTLASFVPDYHELICNFLLLIASERGAEGKAGAGSLNYNWLIFRLRWQNPTEHANELLVCVKKDEQGFIKLKANTSDDSDLNGSFIACRLRR